MEMATPTVATSTYQIFQPESFDFVNPEEWPKWLRRFERFRQASGLAEKSQEAQVNTLIYCMGDRADDILRSFKLSEEDSKSYEVVREKFERHFVKRRNVIFERAKFNSRKQEPGESVDAFITALYALAEHCNYGTLHDEMIRDRIVVGIRNSSLSEKLQLDAELTLTTAVMKVRQSEEVRKQQPLLRGETPATSTTGGKPKPEIPVGAVQRGRRGGAMNKQHKRAAHSLNSQPSICSKCGRTPPHDRRSCPAKDAVCRKCSKRGHFQAVVAQQLEFKRSARKTQTPSLEEWTHGTLRTMYGDCPFCSMVCLQSLTLIRGQRCP